MPYKEKGIKGQHGGYRNLEEKGKVGDYSDLIPPLDYLILENLPDEGTLFGGLYPLTETAINLAKTKFKPMPATDVANRLALLKKLGLALQQKPIRGSRVAYQRTAKGKEVFQEWKQAQKK